MCWDIHIECCIYKVLEYFAGDRDSGTLNILIGEQQLPTKKPDSPHDDTGKQRSHLEDEPNQDKSDTADAEMTEKQQCDESTEFEKSATEPLEHDIAPADSSQTVIDYKSSGEYSVLL